MSQIPNIKRRSFLVVSAAAIGGVIFGIHQFEKEQPNPLTDPDKGVSGITPYLKVDENGITIITPRAEMGQGIQTTLAALVAEELDMAWEDVRIEHGPASGRYYNGEFAGETLPFASTDVSYIPQVAREASRLLGKLMGAQVTAGSSSTVDAFYKMRHAGATARVVLLQAASEKYKVPIELLTTENGNIIFPDGRRYKYLDFATIAADISLPKDVTLKSQSEWRYLGRSMPRLDMLAKCTGETCFGIDVQLPNMVYATVRANPSYGGDIISIDTAQARKSRGVIDIVRVSNGVGVIADNTWRAFNAAKNLDIEWGSGRYIFDTEEMFESIDQSFSAEFQDSQLRNDGDFVQKFEDGKVLKGEYRVPALAHAPLEPMNATVLYSGDRLDVWVGTQIPMKVLEIAAEISGLDEDDIAVHTLPMGGSFGRRLESDYIRQSIELALALKGRPVKMTWTREEDMTHDFCRPMGIAKMSGVIRNGEILAFDASIAYPSVTASQMERYGAPAVGPDVAIVAGAWDQPFSISNYRVTGYRAPDMLAIGSWRSVGASGNGFFHECFFDELISSAGLDPILERIRLTWHEPTRQVLMAVARISSWGRDVPDGKGRGVAFVLSMGVPVAMVIDVSLGEDGVVIDHVYIAADVGIALDPRNIEAQLGSAALWGIGHAIKGEITHVAGVTEQTNFHQFDGLRMYQTPEITVQIIEGQNSSITGVGEVGVPPAAPALCNAIYALTGQRVRQLPMNQFLRFA
jgi:isoquinoline 1-oxidoreductase beta subunit